MQLGVGNSRDAVVNMGSGESTVRTVEVLPEYFALHDLTRTLKSLDSHIAAMMDILKEYGVLILALIFGPVIVYGIGMYSTVCNGIQLNPLETQGPPLMLGKSLCMKDQFLMDILNSPEHLDDCWVVTDPVQPDNPVIFASPGFCAMTGYKSAEIVGRNCRFLQGEGTERRKVIMIHDATECECELAVSLTNYRKDGTPFINEFFITQLHAADGALAYQLGLQTKTQK
jgi:PAS domain S-box-containing protein